LSRFIDDLTIGDDYLHNHLRRNHRQHKLSEIASVDLEDAKRIGKLMRGESRFGDLWPDRPALSPPWCPR
jgi:hypothetical protein